MGRHDKNVQYEDEGTLPVGARLRLLRQSKNISLTQMAKLSKYSKSYLSTVENGLITPSKALIQVYEGVLEFVPGELFTLLELSPEKPTTFLVTKDLPPLKTAGNSPPERVSETADESRPQKIPFDEALLHEPIHFVGREKDITWLMKRIKAGGVAGITALRGLGGIGKTSLAAAVVRKLREEKQFPDGIAVVLCQDLKEPAEVLQRVFSRFDPQYHESETEDPVYLSDVAYRLLHGRRLLVVLDNIRPDLAIEQVVAPLRSAQATLLLTSRHILPYDAVPTDATWKLELLSSDDALKLFAHSLGRELKELERAAAKRIIDALGRHTLAIKLSGTYAANLDRDLDALAELLENPQKALVSAEDELPQEVKKIFDYSLQALPSETQVFFTALAAFGSTEFSRNAAIALASGLDISSSEMHINFLVRQSLVDAFVSERMPRRISDRERIRLHPLLHTLAAAQFEAWPAERRSITYTALTNYYAQYTSKLRDEVSNPDAIIAVLDPDVRNMTAALDQAHEQGNSRQVMELCSVLHYVWDRRTATDTILKYVPWGMAAAEEISEQEATSAELRQTCLHCLAQFALVRGNALCLASEEGNREMLEEAQLYYQQSLEIAEKIHDQQTAIGVTLYRLGRLLRKLGDLEGAEKQYQMALRPLQEVRNQRDEGWTLAFLGQVKHDEGNLPEAERLYQEALTIHQQIAYGIGEAWIIGYLGRLELTYYRQDTTKISHLDLAEKYYQQSLARAEREHDRLGQGNCHSFLGEIALERKGYAEAEVSLQKAYEIQQEIHNTQGEEHTIRLLEQLRLERKALQAETLSNVISRK